MQLMCVFFFKNICLYIKVFLFEILYEVFVFVIVFDKLKVFVFQIHSYVFDPMSGCKRDACLFRSLDINSANDRALAKVSPFHALIALGENG